MLAIRPLIIITIVSATLLPFASSASSFGISPSVLETEVERGDYLQESVSIIRANPNRDEYVLVSIRDDEFGAIQLTSGERFLLPLGVYESRYTFGVDTSLVEDVDQIKAGLSFTNENATTSVGATNIVTGAIMNIDVSLKEPGELVSASDEQDSTPTMEETGSASMLSLGSLLSFFLLTLAVMAIIMCGFFVKTRTQKKSGVFFVCSAVVFFLAMVALAWNSEKMPIHTWEQSSKFPSMLAQEGMYFLLSDEQGFDIFLNGTNESSQSLEGFWNYFVPSSDRVYAVARDKSTEEIYGYSILRFQYDVIKPLHNGDIPGPISSIQDNHLGTYALFEGQRLQTQEPFLCVAEVWESSVIKCEFIEQRFSDDIVDTFFSEEEPHLLVIQTSQSAYAYDVWRKTAVPLETSLEIGEQDVELMSVEEASSVSSRLGFVRLDDTVFLSSWSAEYFPLVPNVWLEIVYKKNNEQVSLVDTSLRRRFFLTEKQSSETIWWFQKGRFITRP
jgi:hypothetical protein